MTRMSCDLLQQRQTIPDPRRVTRNRKHLLGDVLISGFCGVRADGNNFVQIADWARHHEDFVRTFRELPNGIAAHDTYNRVLAAVGPEALQAILIAWLQQRRGIAGDWVPIDGKSMRGTRQALAGLGALHLVRAWASPHGLTLGQVAVDAKSNEITAIAQLWERLDLRDKVVTIDAAGCRKDIAAPIVAGGGDYVLAVKDNQPTLHAEVREAFVSAMDNEVAPLRRDGCEEKGHGRQQRRVVWVLPAGKDLSCPSAWLGLLTLVMVLRVVTCPVSGAETIETGYFLRSLRASARRFARVIGGHGMIENGLHWVLDVVFGEDARRLYDRTAAENVGLLHRLAVSLLRGDASKGSLTVKRKRAACNVGYLAQLLGLPIS